jgi:hypothetical protein
MAYKPNKWGYEGCNCKWKPSGSGTTHANRRAQRKHLQWEELEVKEPDTEEAVEDHVNALEKAAKKARERLEELKAKSLEKDQKTEEEYSYYSYSPSPQPTGKRKLSKRSTKSSSASSSSPLGKDAGKTSLEKDAGKTSLEKGADKTSLEKDKTSLEKGVDKTSLEKGVTKEDVRRTRVAKSGKAEIIKEAKEENSSDEGWVEVKGKTGQKRNHDKPLEKDNKPGTVLKEAPKQKPTAVVDWHHTIEINDFVPEKMSGH